MNKRNEKGFSLIEVMVSAAILGLGVVGMSTLQGVSFSKNLDASDLSIATNVAADMMERIQNNRRNAWAYHNLQTVGAGNCGAGGIPAPRPAYPFPAGAPLSIVTTRAVQGDCVQWGALVRATNLANVQGTVQITPVIPITDKSEAVTVVVQLTWNDRGSTQRQRKIFFQTTIEPE